MKKITILLCAMVLCTTVEAQQLSSQGQKHYSKAQTYMNVADAMDDNEQRTGTYLRAAKELEAVLETDPNTPEPYCYLSMIYNNIGKSSQSLDYLRKSYENIQTYKQFEDSDTAIVIELENQLEYEVNKIISNINVDAPEKTKKKIVQTIDGIGSAVKDAKKIDYTNMEYIKEELMKELVEADKLQYRLAYPIIPVSTLTTVVGVLLLTDSEKDGQVKENMKKWGIPMLAIGAPILATSIFFQMKRGLIVISLADKYSNKIYNVSKQKLQEEKDYWSIRLGLTDSGGFGVQLTF